jgi:DNA polymerase-3 subunit delta
MREIGAYVSSPAPDARLVIAIQVGERAKAPATLSKLVSGGGGKVHEVAVARKELPGWVSARARARGLQIRPDAVAALIETVGESPAVLDQSLGQLAGAFGDRQVGRTEVESQFRGLGEQRVWDLCDRMFERDLAGAIRSLRTLLEAREEALPILGSIASRLRDLLKVRSLPDRMPPAEVARAAGLRFDWQARKYRDQARRFAPGELIRIHQQVVEADRVLKSGGTGDIVLPVLVASVAGPASGQR